MGAALAANTGAAGAMHRVGFFAAKAAPTGYTDRLRIQFSAKSAFSDISYAPIRCFLRQSRLEISRKKPSFCLRKRLTSSKVISMRHPCTLVPLFWRQLSLRILHWEHPLHKYPQVGSRGHLNRKMTTMRPPCSNTQSFRSC